jgi:phospholipid transport system substrate-binding protein
MSQRSFHSLVPRMILLVAALLAAPAAAATAPEAQQFVKERQEELANLVRGGKSDEVDRVFADTLDYDTIARDSLGDAWGTLTPAQQDTFRCVLRKLVARAYHRDLRKTLDYAITFAGADAVEKGFIVRTVVKSKTNAREDPVSITYVVHQAGGAWRIRDIVTEGSSMVASYESQFRRLLKRKGFDELIQKMRDRLGADADACK